MSIMALNTTGKRFFLNSFSPRDKPKEYLKSGDDLKQKRLLALMLLEPLKLQELIEITQSRIYTMLANNMNHLNNVLL